MLRKEDAFCCRCGARVDISRYYEQPSGGGGMVRDKTVTLLLCIFLGIFGAHRFYEGKIATAVIWLLTGGLMGIGWVIDLVFIIFKRDQYYIP